MFQRRHYLGGTECVSSSFLCDAEVNSSEIQIMFIMYCLKRWLNIPPRHHLSNKVELCEPRTSLPMHMHYICTFVMLHLSDISINVFRLLPIILHSTITVSIIPFVPLILVQPRSSHCFLLRKTNIETNSDRI